MIVVADTSPINYLILIGQIELLQVLYEEVLIPFAVLRELQSVDAPPAVRRWALSLPSWVIVQTVELARGEREALDAGEREAIQLALTLKVKTF